MLTGHLPELIIFVPILLFGFLLARFLWRAGSRRS
jgi:hypothetical protein